MDSVTNGVPTISIVSITMAIAMPSSKMFGTTALFPAGSALALAMTISTSLLLSTSEKVVGG